MLGMGKIVFPRKEPLNWLSGAKWSVLKTHLQGTNRLSRLRNYVLSICAGNKNLKGHEHEKKVM